MTIEIDISDLTRLVMLLDASQDALDAAAKAEARRERGKTLQCITEQERAKTARAVVQDISAKYGIEI